MSVKWFGMLVLVLAVMAGGSCSKSSVHNPDDASDGGSQTDDPQDPSDDESQDDFDPNSQELIFGEAVMISFSETGVEINSSYPASQVSVTANGAHVAVESSAATGVLNVVVSGVTRDGSVSIASENDFELTLNGTSVTNTGGPAINILSDSGVKLMLIDETRNRLVDSPYYSGGQDAEGTFSAAGNVFICGGGTLEVFGLCRYGISIENNLDISASGRIEIVQAADDGIHTGGTVTLYAGDVCINSSGDGIDSKNKKDVFVLKSGSMTITTAGQKSHGIKTKGNLEIDENASLSITVSGSASKGINTSGDVVIEGGTVNITTSGSALWEDDEQDISSAAGIKCDGNMTINGGSITITSSGAGGKGINVDGELEINDGNIIVVTSGDQYVHSPGEDTAAKAIKSDGDMHINGGTIYIRTSRTEAEGMESKSTMTISGGSIDIEAYDDGLNATDIVIEGGDIYSRSSVNDAVDSNGTITISGGRIVAIGAAVPETGIDCDMNRFSITGGTVVGIGGSTSIPTESASSQQSLIFIYSATYSTIHIVGSAGEEVLTLTMPQLQNFRGETTLLLSTAAIKEDTEYVIDTGGSVSGGEDFHGLHNGAEYTGGTETERFTSGSEAGSVTTIGRSSRPGNPPGGPGGNPGVPDGPGGPGGPGGSGRP